jgi:hypothetical protein
LIHCLCSIHLKWVVYPEWNPVSYRYLWPPLPLLLTTTKMSPTTIKHSLGWRWRIGSEPLDLRKMRQKKQFKKGYNSLT